MNYQHIPNLNFLKEKKKYSQNILLIQLLFFWGHGMFPQVHYKTCHGTEFAKVTYYKPIYWR